MGTYCDPEGPPGSLWVKDSVVYLRSIKHGQEYGATAKEVDYAHALQQSTASSQLGSPACSIKGIRKWSLQLSESQSLLLLSWKAVFRLSPCSRP